MIPYQGVLAGRIVLLAALAALFLWPALGRPMSRRFRVLAFVVLTGAILSHPNFGLLHPRQSGYRAGAIHYYDAFHYFMGAKYLPEIGYSGLYDATVVAGRELGAFASISHIRDLRSYGARAVSDIDAEALRARFSTARWRAFKQDLLFFGPRIDAWPELLVDRGYNDPPLRALLLHALVARLPATALTVTLLASLDYVLLIVAFALLWRAFGAIPTALALSFFALSFFARFDYIGGSILRWDWIAALLVGAAALERGHGATAGILLGYAALARIFPVLFLLPLLIKWAQGRWQGTPDATVASCLRAALAVMLLASIAVLATPGHREQTFDFVSKMRRHAEDPFVNSVGLGALLVFGTAPWGVNPDGTVFVTAEAVTAARPARFLVPLVSAAYLALALPLILRAGAIESLMYTVPLIFCALSPTGYYYSFLVLLVLLPWRPPAETSRVSLLGMTLLTAITASTYVFELVSPDLIPVFYRASIQLGIFFLLWIGFEYVRLGLLRRHD